MSDELDRVLDRVDDDAAADQAIEWMRQHWNWPPEDKERTIREHPEALLSLVHAFFGHDRWESEFRRFRDANPEFKLVERSTAEETE